jgi:hypothetical protein
MENLSVDSAREHKTANLYATTCLITAVLAGLLHGFGLALVSRGNPWVGGSLLGLGIFFFLWSRNSINLFENACRAVERIACVGRLESAETLEEGKRLVADGDF